MPVGELTADVEKVVGALRNGKKRCAPVLVTVLAIDADGRKVRPDERLSFRYGGRSTIAQQAMRMISTTYVKALLRLPVVTLLQFT